MNMNQRYWLTEVEYELFECNKHNEHEPTLLLDRSQI